MKAAKPDRGLPDPTRLPILIGQVLSPRVPTTDRRPVVQATEAFVSCIEGQRCHAIWGRMPKKKGAPAAFYCELGRGGEHGYC